MMNRIKTSWYRWRAARNIARLYSEDIPPRQAREINPWITNNPEYQEEFLGTLHMLSDMEGLSNDADVQAWKHDDVKPSFSQFTVDHWQGISTALSLIVMVVLGLGYAGSELHSVKPEGLVMRFTTVVGEQRTVDLDDGSTITLNTGTQLLVDMTTNYRRIILEHGEAYFDVAADPTRPFTVNIGSRSVSVLGTQFNIRRSPDKFKLVVIEGVVAVHRKEEAVADTVPLLTGNKHEILQLELLGQRRIEAGWVAEYDAVDKKMSAYQPDNINNLSEWRNGFVHFEGEPLYKVINELNRYSEKKILIEDADIINLNVQAILRFDRLNTTLKGLEKIFPIKITYHHDRIVVEGVDKKSS
jgi:transmembrane sensor